jgi:hypothetical protein
MALVPYRTIPIERTALVGEVIANFCEYRVPRGQRDGSLRPYSRLSRPEQLLFLSSSSSIVHTRLSEARSKFPVISGQFFPQLSLAELTCTFYSHSRQEISLEFSLILFVHPTNPSKSEALCNIS